VRYVPDVLEAVKNVVQSFIDDEPKPPLHVGEVMSCWSFLAAISEIQVQTEAGINSTTDPELRTALHDAVAMFKSQKEQLTSFMLLEGVSLPPTSESKPISNPREVPLGVKLTDIQLANSLKIKVALSITNCANAAAQTVRNDMGLIWAKFLQELLTCATTLKSLMLKRGWLKVPPLYYPPGSPIVGR
jgi:spore coat protein CotF